MRLDGVFYWLLAIPFKSTNGEIRDVLKTEKPVSFASLYVPQNSQLEQTTDLNKIFRLKEDRILHVDNDIIVVNKPAGIQTAPGLNSNNSLATVVQRKVHFFSDCHS